jgi:hypothetical protein
MNRVRFGPHPLPPPPLELIRREAALHADGVVYFIGGRRGAVKIGFTTQTPAVRLAALQTGSPVRLFVLATMPGRERDEQAVQMHFKASRLHGEWFRRTLELRAFIAELAR